MCIWVRWGDVPACLSCGERARAGLLVSVNLVKLQFKEMQLLSSAVKLCHGACPLTEPPRSCLSPQRPAWH